MSARRVLVLGGHSGSLVGFRGAMLRALVAQGDEVLAAAPGSDPADVMRLTSWGVTYTPIPFDRTGLDPFKDLGTYLALKALMLDFRPEVVFSYNVKPILLGGLAAQAVGVPRRYAMIEGLGRAFGGTGPVGAGVAWGAAWLHRVALRGAQALIFLNPDDLRYFGERRIAPAGARSVLLDGIGVDLRHYAPRPVPAGPPVFLLIARLLRAKGVETFVEASRLVRAHHPEVQFHLLGPFESGRGAVTRGEIERWEADGAVRHLGVTDDVRPYLARATAFILPSYYREGLPRTSLEAMASGRPVVTTDWPGCREAVVDGETGFLIPPKDPARLAEALRRYLLEPGLAARHGVAGRALAERRFDEGVITARLVATLREDV